MEVWDAVIAALAGDLFSCCGRGDFGSEQSERRVDDDDTQG